MTEINILSPEPFESNEQYLGWEMLRLQARLTAYLNAKQDPSQVLRFRQAASDLGDTRVAGIEARREAVANGVDIPFHSLSERFGLTPEHEEVLIVCLSPHLSSSNWHLLQASQGSVLKTYLEVGFVADLIKPSNNLLTERGWAYPTSPLIEHGLVFVEPPSDGAVPVSLLTHSIYSPHYVSAAITGVSTVDERLARFCEVIEPTLDLYDVVLSSETRDQVQDFVSGFHQRNAPLTLGDRTWALLVSGPRRSGKTTLASGLAGGFNRKLFVIHLNRLERKARAAELIRLAERNAQFLGAVLLLCQPEQALTTDASLLGTLTSLVSSYQGLVIIEPHDASKLPDAFESLIHFPIEVHHTETKQREEIWESLLPPDLKLHTDVNLGQIATSFGLTGGQIQAAIQWARQRAETRSGPCEVRQDDLKAGARSQVRSKLGDYTEASTVKLTLNDLVLAKEPSDLVQELLAACHNKQIVLNDWGFGARLTTGKGLISLFSGEAGTGKTLCAEILANELELKLHIVSIPKVVSKWVGETEKNIRAIFNHARAQNSMLLFDEADSMFTTRVKVEKAQDHFQNMEVNMLLQEIERFDGIVVLTTNLEANIDKAFERRILFKIHFPAPEPPQRLKIWQTLIPKQTPLEDDLDFGYLADTFELTGGQIKNAIVRAAYRSVKDGTQLTLAQLEDAARQQSKEAGKLTRVVE